MLVKALFFNDGKRKKTLCWPVLNIGKKKQLQTQQMENKGTKTGQRKKNGRYRKCE